MLPLDRQNYYREQYRKRAPGWQTSGEIYESLVRRSIGSGATRILDLGCGSGGLLELVGREVALPVGVDRDLPSLLRHRDRTILLTAGDASRLPFGDETFDIVMSSWLLEHLAVPEPAFSEIARVLVPGGHFIFITPNARNVVTTINRMVPRLAQGRLVRWLYGRAEKDTFPVAYRANTVETIDALARSAGLFPVETRLVSDPTYLAFNDLLFFVASLLERLTPERNFVHIVGDYRKGETV